MFGFSAREQKKNPEIQKIKIKIEQKQKGKGELNCKYVWLRCLLQVPGTVVGRSVQKKKCVRIIYTYVQFYSINSKCRWRQLNFLQFDGFVIFYTTQHHNHVILVL